MIFNSKANKMVSNIYVLGSSMVASIFCESNGSLTVRIEWDRMFEWAEDFSYESMKPEALFGCMGSSHILCFTGRERDKLLLA